MSEKKTKEVKAAEAKHDIDEMNRAWDEWVDKDNAPVRCTVQAQLMRSNWKVEVKVVAGI